MKKTNKKQKHRVLVRDVVGLKSRVCRKLKKESVGVLVSLGIYTL